MKQILQKLISLNLVPILLIGMLAMPVHAETSVAIASGYCGGEGDGTNLSWTLTEDGVLTISGEGKMGDYFYCETPWYDCRGNIKTVVIKPDVTSVCDFAFAYCPDLTSVTIPGSVTTIGQGIFYDSNGLITAGPIGGQYNIQFGWTDTIPAGAFSQSSLTSVSIPESVTSISASAFNGCSELTVIVVDEGNVAYTSVNGVLFNQDKTELIVYPDGKTDATYLIPDSVTTIGSGAFSGCSNLTSVTIPDSVTKIGSFAFASCSSLTSVIIPDGVTSILIGAFTACSGLTSVTIPASVTFIGGHAFDGCARLTIISVDEENPTYRSVDGVLFSKTMTKLILYPAGKTDTTYSIPTGVTFIGMNAFSGCTRLTSVVIPTSVTNIGNYAFSDCVGLTSVVIPEGVTTIDGGAFSWCRGLTSVTIPVSVTTIGSQAFYSCNALKEIVFLGNAPTSLNNKAFQGVTATAYYPGWNDTWTQEVMQNYGGNITWVPFDTAAVLCDTCTETETAVTVLYDPEAAETVTAYLALYDKEGGFLRLETMTEQSNPDGTINLSISYTEEEYAEIGRIAAFAVNGQTMQPLCEGWDTSIA